MNEKLLTLAEEKALDIHVYEGEYSHHETEYTFSESGIVELLQLVQSNNEPNNTELLSAAKAVIERWDSPLWKDLPHTGEFINRLRKATERNE